MTLWQKIGNQSSLTAIGIFVCDSLETGEGLTGLDLPQEDVRRGREMESSSF